MLASMNAWTAVLPRSGGRICTFTQVLAMVSRSLQMALIQPCMLQVEPSREALMQSVFFWLLLYLSSCGHRSAHQALEFYLPAIGCDSAENDQSKYVEEGWEGFAV